MSLEYTKVCKYELYIGLTDLETGKKSVEYEHFLDCVKEYCEEHKIDFSLNKINGGFNHSKIGYIVEEGVVITLLGDDSIRFLNAIGDIKAYINTDTILVTREYLDVILM